MMEKSRRKSLSIHIHYSDHHNHTMKKNNDYKRGKSLMWTRSQSTTNMDMIYNESSSLSSSSSSSYQTYKQLIGESVNELENVYDYEKNTRKSTNNSSKFYTLMMKQRKRLAIIRKLKNNNPLNSNEHHHKHQKGQLTVFKSQSTGNINTNNNEFTPRTRYNQIEQTMKELIFNNINSAQCRIVSSSSSSSLCLRGRIIQNDEVFVKQEEEENRGNDYNNKNKNVILKEEARKGSLSPSLSYIIMKRRLNNDRCDILNNVERKLKYYRDQPHELYKLRDKVREIKRNRRLHKRKLQERIWRDGKMFIMNNILESPLSNVNRTLRFNLFMKNELLKSALAKNRREMRMSQIEKLKSENNEFTKIDRFLIEKRKQKLFKVESQEFQCRFWYKIREFVKRFNYFHYLIENTRVIRANQLRRLHLIIRLQRNIRLWLSKIHNYKRLKTKTIVRQCIAHFIVRFRIKRQEKYTILLLNFINDIHQTDCLLIGVRRKRISDQILMIQKWWKLRIQPKLVNSEQIILVEWIKLERRMDLRNMKNELFVKTNDVIDDVAYYMPQSMKRYCIRNLLRILRRKMFKFNSNNHHHHIHNHQTKGMESYIPYLKIALKPEIIKTLIVESYRKWYIDRIVESNRRYE